MKRRFALVCLSAMGLAAQAASGQTAPAPTTPPASAEGTTNPAAADESVLGTVEVDGSSTAASLPPLIKLVVVPLISKSDADSLTTLVVRHDLELSGQFEVIPLAKLPGGPYTREAPLDLESFRTTGAEFVVRVLADATGDKVHLSADVFVPPKRAAAGSNTSDGGTAPEPVAAYRSNIDTDTRHVRAAAHRLTDDLLGGLTGRPGGFASHLTYTIREGRDRRAYAIDADGFDLQPASPAGVTVLSPAFGPQGRVYYAMSRDQAPFRLAAGPTGVIFPFALPGSIMGLAFSEDHTRAALTTMVDGQSHLWLAEKGIFSELTSAPLANHPALGPLGKVAFAGGTPVQRVYVDGKPISPGGFMASAPAFCDTPEGLLVLFTVGVGSGADLLSTDARGNALRRLTQRQGSNSSPACSPDGRLVAFFSTTNTGQGPGLYLMPIVRPWLAKRVSSQSGDGLRWDRAGEAEAPPTPGAPAGSPATSRPKP